MTDIPEALALVFFVDWVNSYHSGIKICDNLEEAQKYAQKWRDEKRVPFRQTMNSVNSWDAIEDLGDRSNLLYSIWIVQ